MATSDHENATVAHEMRFGRQKLGKNCYFHRSFATLTHEMRFYREKRKKNSDFFGAEAGSQA